MGTYVYRVTAKKVRCSDGVEANVAMFAYKPYYNFGSDNENRKMHFSSGCIASERLAKLGKISDRIVLAVNVDGELVIDKERVYGNPNKMPHFDDYNFGTATSPTLEGVYA